MERVLRVFAAVALVVVAASLPLMGYAAADDYENRKFYGVFEGDWFFLFGFVAAGACLWAAARLLQRRP